MLGGRRLERNARVLCESSGSSSSMLLAGPERRPRRRRSARAVGIAERTSNLRVSKEAEQTPPRLLREPPTNKKGRFTGAFRIDHPGDGNVEDFGIGKKDAASRSHTDSL